jgi:tRNA pseudouridine38-40 synthase
MGVIMKRVMLIIAYDGTRYCGWQTQPNGLTVEEVLNRALTKLLNEPIAVIGASRTDAGVHALGNVAVFDTSTQIPAEKIPFALNQRLPNDIVIQQSREVPLNFHPRRCKSKKTYQYRILNSRFSIPTQRLYTHFIYNSLNIEAMSQAAQYLIGEHDFKSYCSTKVRVTETVRIIYGIKVEKVADIITITISGNGFLYNMVRIIVGTLIKIGMGTYSPIYAKEILEKKDRLIAGPKAPANGLTLRSIEFPDLDS